MLRKFIRTFFIKEKECEGKHIKAFSIKERECWGNSSKPSLSRKESAKENTSKPSPSRIESVEENTSKPYPPRKESAKENTSKPSPKKGCFEDKTNRTIQANSDSYKTDLNANKGACNEARISEEEHVGMRDRMRKGDFEHSNKESYGNISNEEENQLPMCGRKGDAESLNEKGKKVNEEEYIGNFKCSTKSSIDKYNEGVRGWISSSKIQNVLLIQKKRKGVIVQKYQKEKNNEPPLNGMV